MSEEQETLYERLMRRWIKSERTAPGGRSSSQLRGLDGVDVELHWWATPDGLTTRGPRQVVVTIRDDASAAVIERGVTTGVLRAVENKLPSEVAGMEATRRRAHQRSIHQVERKVSGLIEALPPGPKSGEGDYYADLLQIFALMAKIHQQPVNAMLRTLREHGRSVTKATLNKQLQRARLADKQGMFNDD